MRCLTRQAREDNLTIVIVRNKLSSVLVIDNEFRLNVVKDGSGYFDNVMTKLMIDNRTDA